MCHVPTDATFSVINKTADCGLCLPFAKGQCKPPLSKSNWNISRASDPHGGSCGVEKTTLYIDHVSKADRGYIFCVWEDSISFRGYAAYEVNVYQPSSGLADIMVCGSVTAMSVLIIVAVLLVYGYQKACGNSGMS